MIKKSSETGFSLLSVMALAIIVTFAAFTALRMFQQQSKNLVSTLKRDRLEACLDSGLDKAIFQLNETNGWTNVPTMNYFSSLTATTTAFTDMDGYKYWVKVLQGGRVQPTASTSTTVVSVQKLDDSVAEALTNTGDLIFNRTILVRAVDIKIGMTMTAMAILHRSAVSPVFSNWGNYGNTSVNTGGSPGSSFNSCTGSITITACDGVVSSPTPPAAGSYCMPVTTPVTFAPYPPVVLPAGTVPWPFGPNPNTLVTQSYTAPNGNNSYTYNMTTDLDVQVGSVDLRNDNFYITTNGHKLNIYCTGTFGAAGNPGWYVDDPTAPGTLTGGHPSQCWVYVVGPGAVSLGGTGNYELVMIAPESTVTTNGNGSLYGAVVSNVFNKNGSSGKFMFDSCILGLFKANKYARPPIVTVNWVQF